MLILVYEDKHSLFKYRPVQPQIANFDADYNFQYKSNQVLLRKFDIITAAGAILFYTVSVAMLNGFNVSPILVCSFYSFW
jgi:hypothetical protein